MANELRTGINSIGITGIVKEHKLKEGSSEKGKYINGSLVIKTGEFSEVEVKVMVNEKTKDGTKVRKNYETLKKFIDEEYLTLAECKTEEDKENVAKVKIYGNKDFAPHFKEEIFKPEGVDEVITKTSLDLGFGNIYVNSNIKEEEYKADFEVEMYVTSIKEEEKEEEPTGRAIVSGWMPIYGGKVMPITVIAGKEPDDNGDEYDFGRDILDQIEEGMTVDFWGDINYQSRIIKTKKGGGLGRAKIEEKKEYINELIAVGADVQDDEEKEFDGELVKKAKIERDVEIENKKNEASTNNKKKGLSGSKEDKPRRPRPNF